MRFFFNDTATTEIYTLSLHDALPILFNQCGELCKTHGMKFGYHNHDFEFNTRLDGKLLYDLILENTDRSEEHTSELQSRQYLVCRLLLEKNQARARRTRSTTFADTHQ